MGFVIAINLITVWKKELLIKTNLTLFVLHLIQLMFQTTMPIIAVAILIVQILPIGAFTLNTIIAKIPAVNLKEKAVELVDARIHITALIMMIMQIKDHSTVLNQIAQVKYQTMITKLVIALVLIIPHVGIFGMMEKMTIISVMELKILNIWKLLMVLNVNV